MGTFTRSIRKVFENAGRSFLRYPAVIGNALLFSLVAAIRISMDWQDQLPYAFLFNSLQWAFALGAIFSLAAITWSYIRAKAGNAFVLANLAGIAVTIAAFLLLYFLGGTAYKGFDPAYTPDRMLTTIATARVFVAGLLSLFAFLLLAGTTEEGLDFSGAVFMTLKAFFLALIYGLVIMAGVSGVFGAIQGLLYPEMSGKVYQYIATISGFIGFSIFVGYFPDFRKGSADEHRQVAQLQPRFITVLLEFILVPIMLALTVVLLLWAGRTILNGMDTNFMTLNGITSAFAIGGLLLHILITKNDSATARFYRRIFPMAVLLILLFEAWALVLQLSRHGLKTTEYLFILLWVVAFAAAVLLILKQSRGHRYIVYVTSLMAIIAVLPFLGFTDLPLRQQTGRLESILTQQNMLVDGQIKPAQTAPPKAVQEAITETVDFLIYADHVSFPTWLDPDKLKNEGFRTVMGFERTYGEQTPGGREDYRGVGLFLGNGTIDIREYDYQIPLQVFMKEPDAAPVFTGTRGKYEISWQPETATGPVLDVRLDGTYIHREDLKAFTDNLRSKYPADSPYQELQAQPGDLTWVVETNELKLMMVFGRVEISNQGQSGREFLSFDLNSIFVREK